MFVWDSAFRFGSRVHVCKSCPTGLARGYLLENLVAPGYQSCACLMDGVWVPGGIVVPALVHGLCGPLLMWAISIHIGMRSGQPCAARATWELTSCIQFHQFEEAALNSA